MSFGAWLRRQLRRTDQNATGLAMRLGVSQAAVSDWMRGVSQPSDENRRKLAHVLGVPTDEVYRALGHIPPPVGEDDLSLDQRRVLLAYDRLSPENQRLIEALLDAMLAAPSEQPDDDSH
jgi:transcriptional regulator with XRE-family HTH domain